VATYGQLSVPEIPKPISTMRLSHFVTSLYVKHKTHQITVAHLAVIDCGAQKGKFPPVKISNGQILDG